MATADQYAEWIVGNAAKRGTPEFETVTQAYELAKSEERQSDISTRMAPAPSTEPTLGQQIVGAGETALAVGTGATTGTLGLIGGTAKGLVQSILDGSFGTQQANRMVEQAAVGGMEALTYAPRTAEGQRMTQATGEVLQHAIPMIPLSGELAAVGRATALQEPAMAAARDIAMQRGTQAAQTVGSAISTPVMGAINKGRELAGLSADASVAVRRTTGRSGGSAATPEALVRADKAASFETPVELTLGAETRDAAQLAFEKEALKRPDEMGQMLRDRAEDNNQQILQNFETLFERTGAEAVDPVITGNKVKDALMSDWKKAKSETRAAYETAKKSPEADAPVLADTSVTVGAGDQQIVGSLLDYVNDRIDGVEPAVAANARQQLIRFGIAAEDANGKLVSMPATVKRMEDFRQEMAGAADSTRPRQIRDEIIIQKIIDATTEPVAGPLFRAARTLRRNQSNKFENRAIVNRLITDVRGMADPKVAADQVFQKSILNGRPEEITHLKRVLSLSDDGQQAWKELQGSLTRHIQEAATKGVGTDSVGRKLVSPAQLNQVVSALDANGRLDLVLGKKSAEVIRDLNDVSKYISTTPPGTLINNSGTAGTLMAAMADIGIAGTLTGAPMPIVLGLRAMATHMKNEEMRAKVIKALNVKPTTGSF